MSLKRYAARRDKNERELIEAAERLGAYCVQTGPLDLWVGYGGRFVPVEVKSPKGKYTESEQLFIARCQHNYLPVWTWRTVDDVLKCLTNSTRR